MDLRKVPHFDPRKPHRVVCQSGELTEVWQDGRNLLALTPEQEHELAKLERAERRAAPPPRQREDEDGDQELVPARDPMETLRELGVVPGRPKGRRKAVAAAVAVLLALFGAAPSLAQSWSVPKAQIGVTGVYDFAGSSDSTGLDVSSCAAIVWAFDDNLSPGTDTAAAATLRACASNTDAIGDCPSIATMSADSLGTSVVIGYETVRVDVTTPPGSGTARVTVKCSPSASGGTIDSTTDLAGSMCGTNELLLDEGSSWACRPHEVVYSLAAWKACLESTGSPSRACVLAPGVYDANSEYPSAGGLYVAASYFADEPVPSWSAICLGSYIYSTASAMDVGPENDSAIVLFNLSKLEHDSQVLIDGCNIGYSNDTDETGLLIEYDGSDKEVGQSQQGNHITIRNVTIGEDSSLIDGTERALWIDARDVGSTGQSVSIYDSKMDAFGNTIVQVDMVMQSGLHGRFFADGLVLHGSTTTPSRANNLCLSLNPDGTIPLPESGVGTVAQLRNFEATSCGGIDVVSNALILDGKLGWIGTSGESGPAIKFWGQHADIEVVYTEGPGSGPTVDSNGPFVQLQQDGASADVTVYDTACARFDAAQELFEVDTGVDPGVMTGKLIEGLYPGTGACSATPFGNTLLAATLTSSRGSVDAFGTTLAYNGSAEITKARDDLTPFRRTFMFSSGAVKTLCPTACGDPDTGVTISACGSPNAAQACATSNGDWNYLSVVPLNYPKPLIVNSMRCYFPDETAVTDAGADDKVDIVLQYDTTSTADGPWTSLGGSLGTTGSGRVSIGGLDSAGFTDVLDGWSGAVVVPASTAYGLRAVATVSVDDNDSISDGATAFRANCTVSGWN